MNKGTQSILEAYSKVLHEMSPEDHKPELSSTSPSYVPLNAAEISAKKYPVKVPKNNPYEQLHSDALWLKKHAKDFSGLAGEKIREIAFNLEDLYNQLTRGY